MTLENITLVWGWATLFNYLLLLIWFTVYTLGSDKVYRLHSRFFTLSYKQFSQLHYSGMMFYKLAICLFLLTPYIALKFVPS